LFPAAFSGSSAIIFMVGELNPIAVALTAAFRINLRLFMSFEVVIAENGYSIEVNTRVLPGNNKINETSSDVLYRNNKCNSLSMWKFR
jgi:hypothetical protein